jgi:hypothetical protein
MGFPPADRTGDIVLRVERLAKAYARPLFADVSDQRRGQCQPHRLVASRHRQERFANRFDRATHEVERQGRSTASGAKLVYHVADQSDELLDVLGPS